MFLTQSLEVHSRPYEYFVIAIASTYDSPEYTMPVMHHCRFATLEATIFRTSSHLPPPHGVQYAHSCKCQNFSFESQHFGLLNTKNSIKAAGTVYMIFKFLPLIFFISFSIDYT